MFENKIYFFAIIIAITGIVFGIDDNKSNGDALDVQDRQARALENIAKQLETIANNSTKNR
jgi:hypothetical protein